MLSIFHPLTLLQHNLKVIFNCHLNNLMEMLFSTNSPSLFHYFPPPRTFICSLIGKYNFHLSRYAANFRYIIFKPIERIFFPFLGFCGSFLIKQKRVFILLVIFTRRHQKGSFWSGFWASLSWAKKNNLKILFFLLGKFSFIIKNTPLTCDTVLS